MLGLLCRHLLIPLMSAERAWAAAMELKSEMQDQASAGPANDLSLWFDPALGRYAGLCGSQPQLPGPGWMAGCVV